MPTLRLVYQPRITGEDSFYTLRFAKTLENQWQILRQTMTVYQSRKLGQTIDEGTPVYSTKRVTS